MLFRSNEYLAFDLSKVRALQENETARMERYTKALTAGGIMRSEYRTMLGLKSTPEDDVYLTDIKLAQSQDMALAKFARDSQQRAAIYSALGIE